jgi:hypothetical protein
VGSQERHAVGAVLNASRRVLADPARWHAPSPRRTPRR